MWASTSLDEELVEVLSGCTSVIEFCNGSTHDVSNHGTSSLDSVSSHSVVSEAENLHKSQGLQRHHVTSQLKVSDSDISSTLEHYYVFH